MTNQELIAAATSRLRQLGIDIPDKAGFTVLSDAIGTIAKKRTYNGGRADHVRAWMAPQRPEPAKSVFRPLKVLRHPRLAEIERAQPPMIAAHGVGNGTQFSKEWGR